MFVCWPCNWVFKADCLLQLILFIDSENNRKPLFGIATLSSETHVDGSPNIDLLSIESSIWRHRDGPSCAKMVVNLFDVVDLGCTDIHLAKPEPQLIL